MNGNGVWKWIAALLATFILASVPGIVQIYRAPSRQELEFIRGRQEVVLQRLAALDVEIIGDDQRYADIALQLRELEALLREHVINK